LAADLGDRQAARMQVAALAERDQLLDDRPQILRLRQCRDDLLVLDKRRREVREHRLAVANAAAEPATGKSMAHRTSPSVPCARTRLSWFPVACSVRDVSGMPR